jgi:hypothetical protein
VEYKFFFWLAMQDRCWTHNRRHRHGISDDATCTLCLQLDESIDHLIIACVFSREVWLLTLQKCGWPELAPVADEVWLLTLQKYGWQELVPMADGTLVNWWLRSRDLVPLPGRAAFDSLIVCRAS